MKIEDLEEIIEKYRKAKKKLDNLETAKLELNVFAIASDNLNPRVEISFGFNQVTIEEFTVDDIGEMYDKLIEGLKADIELYRIQLEELGFK